MKKNIRKRKREKMKRLKNVKPVEDMTMVELNGNKEEGQTTL